MTRTPCFSCWVVRSPFRCRCVRAALVRVSKQFRELASREPVWGRLLQRTWPNLALENEDGSERYFGDDKDTPILESEEGKQDPESIAAKLAEPRPHYTEFKTRILAAALFSAEWSPSPTVRHYRPAESGRAACGICHYLIHQSQLRGWRSVKGKQSGEWFHAACDIKARTMQGAMCALLLPRSHHLSV